MNSLPAGHTGDWNPPKCVDPNGIPFGYGYPRAVSGVVPPAVTFYAVQVYWKFLDGQWKVTTMFPEVTP